MRVAYADPPYLGCGQKKYGQIHPEAADWDNLETHRALIDRLEAEFPAGWALSLSTPSLRVILPLCPERVRVLAWVKPFVFFKPGVRLAYAWEPVILAGGRPGTRSEWTIWDWCSTPNTFGRGCPGAKPDKFSYWLFDALGLRPEDEFHDLFPGSGAVTRAWKRWSDQRCLSLARVSA